MVLMVLNLLKVFGQFNLIPNYRVVRMQNTQIKSVLGLLILLNIVWITIKFILKLNFKPLEVKAGLEWWDTIVIYLYLIIIIKNIYSNFFFFLIKGFVPTPVTLSSRMPSSAYEMRV